MEKKLTQNKVFRTIRNWLILAAALTAAWVLCSSLSTVGTSDTFVPMIFILAVLIVSLTTDGYFYGIVTSLASVIGVNYALTFPYMKLNFSIYGYPVTFVTMLAVSLVISTLTTRAREQEKLRHEAAQAKLRADLLRAISHDLRTPLTSISGNASNLLSNADCFDKETKKQLYLDIYDDSMWLINLVENMLSVTRLEEGHMNLNISVELLDDVIQEALRHVDRKKEEHTITVEHEDELLLARMDSRLIVQTIINLVDNAIKYTQKGSHINIRTRKEGENAVILVADDGPGISDEMKEHIFEIFYTGTNKIADSRRSLGLGLALCKSIVNVLGGEITVSDAQPHGAVFQFTLPAGEVYLYE